jgi:hypothetical protein
VRKVSRRLAPVYLWRRLALHGPLAHFELRPSERRAVAVFAEAGAAGAAVEALNKRLFGMRLPALPRAGVPPVLDGGGQGTPAARPPARCTNCCGRTAAAAS